MKKYYRTQFWKDGVCIAESAKKEIATLNEDKATMIDVVGNEKNYLVIDDKGDLILIPFELIQNCVIKFPTYK